MLPKEHRLTKNKDFERVAKFGRPFYSRELGIKLVKNNLSVSRFGIVVGLKVSKKAVQRNKVKRRLREIIRLHLGKIRPGYDVMVLVQAAILELDFHRIEEKLLGLFKKAGLI